MAKEITPWPRRLVSVSGIMLSAIVNSVGLDVKDTYIFFSANATKARRLGLRLKRVTDSLVLQTTVFSNGMARD